MKKYQLASLLWLVSSVHGQSLVDIRTQTKNVDFSGAASTIPAKSGTTLPATCNAGEMFFKTNNTPGQNLYGCEPANTWTQLAGSTNGTVSTATSGQFGFYAGSGNILTGHTLTASDIPALNYQSPLTFTGSGAKTATSTGTLLTNDCAKWDASGNIIDSGSPCASIATGSVGQFGFYSASGNALTPHTLTASDIPPLSYQSPITFTGNGAKAVTSTGTLTASDCAKWDASGNIIDAGGPCSNVASGTVGQFAFYSAAGTALTGHTLAAADIPALNYQAPLSFTGTGTKTITSTAAGVSNNCAKWDANGNVIDAGAPCGTGGGASAFAAITTGSSTSTLTMATGGTLTFSGTGVVNANQINGAALPTNAIPFLNASGQFTAAGLTGTGSLVMSNLPNLNSPTLVTPVLGTPTSGVLTNLTGLPLTTGVTGVLPVANGGTGSATPGLIQGTNVTITGSWPNQTISATGGGTSAFSGITGGTNTSAAFVIGSGASLSAAGTGTIAATSVPAAGVTGLAPSATSDTTNATNITSGTLAAARLPAVAVVTTNSTGSGTKYASATASGTANNCAKWDSNGNVVDAGAPCGTGSGGSALSTPSATTVSNIPQYSNTTGTAISAGLGLVTTLGNPGLDTNIPSEKAIRTAIAAISVSSGALPAQSGSAGYLVSNGTSANWGDMVTGPSGALCAGTGCSGGTPGIVDIVTSVVPRLAAANTFTGVNKFQQLQVTIYTVATLPTCNSSFEGQMEGVSDAASPSYLATVTGGGTVHVPVYCNGTSWVAH